MRPEDVHLVVVGTGPIGLEAAAWAKHRGYQLTILEKQSAIGGDWLKWGNPWSKLQSHRDGYLLSGPVTVPGEDELPSYPSREAMLQYFCAFAKAAGIANHIRFNCTVIGRSDMQDDRKIKVFYTEAGRDETAELEATHIFAAPGRVNKRRQLCFPGEPDFHGCISWGNGQDLCGYTFTGKSVVIVGHGSFAIENARHALEQGAASVVMIARHNQLIMSRAAGFFVERNVDRDTPAMAVVHALRKAYEMIGYDDEKLEQLLFSPATSMFPTSDFYFLAQAAGKLEVLIGSVEKLDNLSVETADGVRVPADVFIKCVGFTQDTAFDAAMKADFKKGGRVGSFHYSDKFVTKMKRNSFFVGGAGGQRHVAPCYDFICKVEGLPNCDLAASNNLLRKRVANRSRSTQTLEAFILEQKNEWEEYCALLGVSISYPYNLQDMLDWDGSLEDAKPIIDRRGDIGVAFNSF